MEESSKKNKMNNLSNKGAIITVADYELALKKASEVGLIAYNAGDSDFNILSDSIFYSSNNKKMNIVLSVDEGPQYKYRNFSWEGMTLFDQETLERALALDKSERYSEEDFNMAVFSRVQGLYLDRGYIYSRVEPKITPIGEDSLDIHFMITENHKVYINEISIKGNTRTRENVIRRQLRVFPGDVYNQDLIARSYREVMMLNFFANASPNIVPVSYTHLTLPTKRIV